jgi:hypothetical protein
LLLLPLLLLPLIPLPLLVPAPPVLLPLLLPLLPLPDPEPLLELPPTPSVLVVDWPSSPDSGQSVVADEPHATRAAMAEAVSTAQAANFMSIPFLAGVHGCAFVPLSSALRRPHGSWSRD